MTPAAQSISDHLQHFLPAPLRGNIVISSVCGLLALILGDLTPSDRPVLLIVSTLAAAVCGSGLLGWARLITARAAARDAESSRNLKENDAVLNRIHQSYQLQLVNSQEQLKFVQANNKRFLRVIGEERKAKHAIAGEWGSALQMVALLREIMIELGLSEKLPEPLKVTDYRKAVQQFDDKIAEILASEDASDTDPEITR